MDWITKLEEQRRSKSAAELDLDWSRMQGNERFRDRVAMRLLPIIADTIAQLKERTGVVLTPQLSDAESYDSQGRRYRTAAIIVRAVPLGKEPSRDESLQRLDFRFNEIVPAAALWQSSLRSSLRRTGNHHFIITELSEDGRTVRVEAHEDWRIDRGELPDDMSPRDWYGEEETYFIRNDLENLIASDIQILLEWLVGTETSDRSIGFPLASSVLREQNEHKSAKRNAWLGLACGILAFPGSLLFLAPLAIFLGIRAYRNPHLVGSSKYYDSAYAAETGAKWAIGLGIFGTVILIIALIGLASSGTIPTSTARPEAAGQKHGAIAYSVSTKRIGAPVNYPDLEGAKARALQECNASDCELKIWFWDVCAALARAGNGQALASGGNSKSEAESAALEECRKIGKNCTVISSVCSGQPKQPGLSFR